MAETQIATTKTFQEKMYEKIRDQIGDLMTEEDLKKVVDAAMQKAFFEPRVTIDRWGREEGKQLPLFVELIQNQMRDEVKKACEKWIADHTDEFNGVLKDTLGKGIVDVLYRYFAEKLQQPLYNLMGELQQKNILS